MMARFPNLKVQLTGQDGNAFTIIGICLKAMRRVGISQEIRNEFQAEATSGDYNHLLATCMKWFDVE